MSLFSNLIKGRNPSSRKKPPAAPDPVDPLQTQREQLSKSIIPGKTRLAEMASEQARQGAPTAVGGAFGVGSQTPMFQAEKEEEQTGRRFNRKAGQALSNQRILGRNGLGGAFGRF